MKQRIPSIVSFLIILFFFIGAIAIFIYQYIMLVRQNETFENLEKNINHSLEEDVNLLDNPK